MILLVKDYLCVLTIYCVLNNNAFKLFSREHIIRLMVDLIVGLPTRMGSFKFRTLIGSDRCKLLDNLVIGLQE